MSNGIQLTSVKIRDFRRLSQQVVEFADGPGITILVGPNGSGKSTVLDAIEWALTGSASRLPAFHTSQVRRSPDVFRSLGSTADPEVALVFAEQDGSRNYKLSSGDEPAEITKLLRRPEPRWDELHSIEAALRWTHFSSQRSTARLGYENDDAVLKAFAAPAGLEKFKGLDQRLWGSQTRNALKELQKEASDRVRQHEIAFEHAKRLGQSPLADPASGVAKRLRDLIKSVSDQTHLDLDAGLDVNEIETAILGYLARVEKQLAELRHLTAEQRDANLRLRRLAAEEEAARQASESLAQLSERRDQASSLADAERRKAEQQLAEMRTARSNLAATVANRTLRQEVTQRLTKLYDQQSEIGYQSSAIERGLANLAELEQVGARVRAGLVLAEMIRSMGDTAVLDGLLAQRSNLRNEIARSSERRESLVGRRGVLQQQLAQEHERISTMSALATAIAEHLHEHDTECPLCSATYAIGELARRAQEMSITPGAGTQQIAHQLNDVTQELGATSGQLQVLASRLDDIEARIALHERQKIERERQQLVFGASWSPELQDQLEMRLLDIREALGLDDGMDARAVLEDLENRQGRLLVAKATIDAEISIHITQMDSIIDVIERDGDDAGLRSELRSLEAQTERASTWLHEAQTNFRVAEELAETAKLEAARALATLNTATANAQEEGERLQNIDTRVSLLASGTVTSDVLSDLQEQSIRAGSFLERIGAIRSELGLNTPITRRDDELAVLRSAYLPSDQQASAADLVLAIERELERSRDEIRALEGLRSRLMERAKVRRKTDRHLHGSALRPWNSLFGSVYASLAGSFGETLEWITDRVDLRFNELESHAVPRVGHHSLHGWLAGHFFSEGQLAALQISSMITASVLFPWSRWQALLLDDPLQHADVIKVGAFADLIRGLCEDRGHQVILTTHDHVQADFIAAKFLAAKLGAKIVRFDRSSTTYLSNQSLNT
ncbi:AAA family ATPase [Rhizobium leguminosarum]|uniref:AAA family ATPase n=1 Tax=Rhizobium leguminosarum TaxID=384 RepID=UPI001C95F27B|nr:AAA family ATPase [Rhizobium leguminosarum]MBY5811295.1 AAA family ATPase [Rhizobium leguminosarum]